MGSFQPLSKNRAEEIRRTLRDSQEDGQSLIYSETGQLVGTGPVSPSQDDQRNRAGRMKVHYVV